MRAKLATALFVMGSILAPTAAYAWGTNAKSATETKTERAKQSTDDAAITTKVKAAMAKDREVSARNIHVKTENGVVRLSGNAKSREEAQQAVSIAQSIQGVTSVDNQINVASSSAKVRTSTSRY